MLGRSRSQGGDERLRLAAATATAAVAFAFGFTPLFDVDWGWHLATAQRLLDERSFGALAVDRFASQSRGEYLPVHWLFQLALHAAHATFGVDGIVVLRATLVTLVTLALHRALRRRGLGPIAALSLATTAAALSRIRLMERPHLATMLGLVVLLDVLHGARDRAPRRLFWLIPLFALWANAHPGCVHGALLALGWLGAEAARALACALAARRDAALAVRGRALLGEPLAPGRLRALGAAVALGLLATLATPYGWRLYPYLLEHRDLQRELAVVELRPLAPLEHVQDAAFVVALAAALAVLALGRRALDLVSAGAAGAFVVLACVVAREYVLALIAVAFAISAPLAVVLQRIQAGLERRSRAARVAILAAGLSLGFLYPAGALALRLTGGGLRAGLERGFYPVGAADFILRERPAGPLWNVNAVGGYLIHRLYPGWLVSTDGRQPLFRAALRMRWSEVETTLAPRILVLDERSPPHPVEADPAVVASFALVHVSSGGRVYLRRDAANAALIERTAYRALAFVGAVPGDGRPNARLVLVAPASPATAGATHRPPLDAPLAELRRALADDPGGYFANLGLAALLASAGRRAEALAHAHAALAARPRSSNAKRLADEIERSAGGG